MRQSDEFIPINQTNHSFLADLYETCHALQLIRSQYQFSEFCGRRPSWFSATKARDLPISTDAAMHLSFNLLKATNLSRSPDVHRKALQLSAMLLDLIEQRVELRS